MYVIGTAGHVDHGKTSLVHQLTGINTDRLAEEQRRGMTIELGFAWMQLPSGRDISLVDVPGHERFIKHMLAGVGGFDAAMLVIAADESVMPQTREHLAIIDLLDIRHGVIVVTKADLVEPAWLPLVCDDIRSQLQGTTLADAPMVVVSARTGAGIPTLLQTLDTLIDTLPPPLRRDEPARLWVDRVFSVDGFGAVVTGTLLAAPFQVGMDVEIAPRGLTARIRGLQMHRRKIDVAQPGTRIAVNLAGVSHHDISRGTLLVVPQRIVPSARIDVLVHVADIAPRPLSQGMHLDLFVGAAETPARVTILAGDTIAPGHDGWVQLHLATPLPLWRGDRLILRQPSPSMTVAGGRVVDTAPPRHRRNRPDVIRTLDALARATPADLCWAAVRGQVVRVAAVHAQTHLPSATVTQTLATHPDVCILTTEWVADRAVLDELLQRICKAIDSYTARYPLRLGIPREEARRRIDVPVAVFDALLQQWQAHIEACGDNSLLRRVGYQVQLSVAAQRQIADILAQLAAHPYAPPALSVDRELLLFLQMSGRAVEIADGILLHADAWHTIVSWVFATIDTTGSVSVAQVRDQFDTSRKYALAILEYMDAKQLTRRRDDVRVRA
ncbi:MAG: selenocysteine-specific translation elongation factor [Chloroflexota bacterium]|jgi:selenocysteine-specific elongation factor